KTPCIDSDLPPKYARFPDYDEKVRDAILGLVGDVNRPAWASEPLVEVVLMKRNDGGESLVLLNYTNAGIAALTVTVPNWNGTAHALFADTDIVFESGVATLTLGDVEVLKLV